MPNFRPALIAAVKDILITKRTRSESASHLLFELRRRGWSAPNLSAFLSEIEDVPGLEIRQVMSKPTRRGYSYVRATYVDLVPKVQNEQEEALRVAIEILTEV